MRTLFYIRSQQIRYLLHGVFNSKKWMQLGFISLFTFSILLGLTGWPWLYLSVAGLFIVILHLVRNDIVLIKKTGLNVQLLMIVEYLLMSIPFLIQAAMQKKTGDLIIYVVFLVCLPCLIPPGIYSSFKINFNKKIPWIF